MSRLMYQKTFDLLMAEDPTYRIQDRIFKMRIPVTYSAVTWLSFVSATKTGQKAINDFGASSGYVEINCGVLDGICGAKTIAAAKKYLFHLDSGSGVYVNSKIPIKMLHPMWKNAYNIIDPMKTQPPAGGGAIYFRSYFTKKSMYCQKHGGEMSESNMHQKFNQAVIHETVTNNAQDTVSVLNIKNLSTHFVIDIVDGKNPSAIIWQTAPLASVCYHIGADNNNSVGIDVVTPFYPSSASGHWLSQPVINNKHMHKGKYVALFDIQIKALVTLMEWLSNINRSIVLTVKQVYNLEDGKKVFRLGEIDGMLAGNEPGYVSHQALGGHSDGAFPLLMAYLMMNGYNGQPVTEPMWSLVDYPPDGSRAPRDVVLL